VTERPDESFDDGLQHERTALAWERTAIAVMVGGIVFARFAALDAHRAIALLGLAQTIFGGGLLIWSSMHYEDLHDSLRAAEPVVHPQAARVVGILAIASTWLALLTAIATG
jgi:uncharacterized membrane protein YidH (DUF202 family)